MLSSGSYGPSNVLDGARSTFFAGDHDIGVSAVGFHANFDAVGFLAGTLKAEVGAPECSRKTRRIRMKVKGIRIDST